MFYPLKTTKAERTSKLVLVGTHLQSLPPRDLAERGIGEGDKKYELFVNKRERKRERV